MHNSTDKKYKNYNKSSHIIILYFIKAYSLQALKTSHFSYLNEKKMKMKNLYFHVGPINRLLNVKTFPYQP